MDLVHLLYMKMSVRNQLITLIDQDAIPADKIDDALVIAKVTPSGTAWVTFINHLLVWLGGLALAFSVLFFIAYNWQDIGLFAQFAMVEVVIALAIAAYWKLGSDSVAAKVSLLMATIFVGVLLALYGQTYQTGADPWQLFFSWSLLILPWVLVGRFAAIWIVWILLVNTTLILYQQTFLNPFWLVFGSDTAMLWTVFLFNTLALAIWEFLTKTYHWLSVRGAIRLLAVASGVSITWLVLHSIFEYGDTYALAGLIWLAWMGTLYFVYRKMRPDLFMLAGGCLTGIVVVVSFFSKHMLDKWEAGALFFLSLLVVGLGSGAAVWLKKIHSELSV